ncbi:MAG: hypothetical protein Q9M36_01150 [Sulfurovum sp.]|nr:hypothetical protein [Sulfurovum sp.]
MPIALEEYLVLALLQVGVWGSYILLKLHYIFAFGLVQKTSLSQEKKQKIEKIKYYVFIFLKLLFLLGFLAMLGFGTSVLLDGESLKGLVITLWHTIPEGFWLLALWTIIRIALLIIVMRYILGILYKQLDKREAKVIRKNRYNSASVHLVYLRLHNSIKFTIVLGVMYRIVHFFPFLEEVSYVFLLALLLFIVVALFVILRETLRMLKTRI